jgi:hypothetical protein
MAMLASLKLTQAKKPAHIPPVQVRRNKLVKRLHEQIELARAEQGGSTYSPKRYKTVTDEEGNRRTIEISKRIKAWWFVGVEGRLCLNVRYGAKTLELAKGKTAVEIATQQDLVPTLELIKAAVEAGELDQQMDAASGSLRKGFQR